MSRFDVIIIGGGAAGLMCAMTAGKQGRNVLVLEGSNKIGKKILMSGGGRCNFTNRHTSAADFLGANPKFCISALNRYTQLDFIHLVERHGVRYHEKAHGQLFCDRSSKDVVALLAKECEESGVTILTRTSDTEITAEGKYTVDCSHGRYFCSSLVIATGGLSIPKMGASDFGYRIAQQFGHTLRNQSAGLVPFTVTGSLHTLCNRLAGVSCRIGVRTRDTLFTGDMLFTHRGLSGPAVLQISSYWEPGETIEIDFLPDIDGEARLLAAKTTRPRSLLRVVLAETLPKALVQELQQLFWSNYAEMPLGEIKDDELRRVGCALHSWFLKPAATEGYRTAEVTLGGVCTSELSSQTMESKKHSSLYFIGEVVDVTGHLGGHNFQWAWSSGYAAGISV